MTEEMTELAAAKDELFALSNKAQLGGQRAQHYEDEAEALVHRAAMGRRELEDLERQGAPRTCARVEELEASCSELDAEAEERRRAYQELEQVHGEQRGALAGARRALEESANAAAQARTQLARLESEIQARGGARRGPGRAPGRAGRGDRGPGGGARAGGLETTAHRREAVGASRRQRRADDRRGPGRERGWPSSRATVAAASWSWRRCARRRTGAARAWSR